jgi:hypothetical protein
MYYFKNVSVAEILFLSFNLFFEYFAMINILAENFRNFLPNICHEQIHKKYNTYKKPTYG